MTALFIMQSVCVCVYVAACVASCMFTLVLPVSTRSWQLYFLTLTLHYEAALLKPSELFMSVLLLCRSVFFCLFQTAVPHLIIPLHICGGNTKRFDLSGAIFLPFHIKGFMNFFIFSSEDT